MLTTDELKSVINAIEQQAVQERVSLGITFFEIETERSFSRAMQGAPEGAALAAYRKAQGALRAEGNDDTYVLRRGGATVAVLAVSGSGDHESHHNCLLAGVRVFPPSWQS